MRNTLICTVGTSLFQPNRFKLLTAEKYQDWLKGQPESDQEYLSLELFTNLKTAFTDQNCSQIANYMTQIPGETRLCGAEINSITDLIEREYCTKDCLLIFCHSETKEGQEIANILEDYYRSKGHRVKLLEITGLQDEDPKKFRTYGLRNLAKKIGQVVREQSAQFCAINATGGYKAQIAIGVLMGQALGVPVYYKHERFSEIIAFPPMPVSLDFDLWLQKSGLLNILEKDVIRWQTIEDDWDERLESLVERVTIDGDIYLELSPTGQIFHETFKGRFASDRDLILPPPIPENQKQKPRLSDHSWGIARNPIQNFMEKIINECPYVRACHTDYWNPDLSSPTLFKIKGEQIQGIYSNGSWTVKLIIETSANTTGQRNACIADLNSRFG